MKKIILFFLFLINFSFLFAQKKDSSDNIIIYGDSFLFSIHEPKGWLGDVDNAKNYNANIIFYKNKEDFKKGGLFIQVLTYKKQDEEVNKDMEQDMVTLKEKSQNMKIQTVDITSSKSYSCFAKLAYSENLFYKYIAYVNPGNQYRNAFSVSMNTGKRPATKEEMNSFKEIVSSLVIFKR